MTRTARRNARIEADNARRQIVADLVADRAKLEEYIEGALQILSDGVIAAAVKTGVDVNALVKQALANRGLDTDAQWIGFDESAKRYGR